MREEKLPWKLKNTLGQYEIKLPPKRGRDSDRDLDGVPGKQRER